MRPFFGFLLVVALLGWAPALAQDPQLTQFYHAPLYLNPAFTGTTEEFRVAGSFRYQWTAIDAQFQTTTVAFDYNAAPLRSGFGLLLQHDRAGSFLTTTGVTGLYSFLVPLSSDWHLRLGLQGGVGNRQLDFSQLVFVSQVRPDEPDVWEGGVGGSRWFADVSSGAVLYNRHFWGGVAVHHLNRPNASFFPGDNAAIPLKLSAHLGANLPISTINGELYLLPALLYRQQGPLSQLDVSTRLAFERFPLVVGLAYRGIPFRQNFNSTQQDAVAFTAGLQTGKLTFGYSYDLTVSGIRPYSGGSHEIALVYQWGSQRTRTKRGISCPIYERPSSGGWNLRQ
jgi:type IX secretion system PorP/SprF family membrane protein